MLLLTILIELCIAAFVGWATGKIMGYEANTFENILMGLAGGVVGSFIVGLIGLQASSFLGSLIISIIGAALIVILYRSFFKR